MSMSGNTALACLWAASAFAQSGESLPRLRQASLGPAPWNVAQSGGIVAYDVRVDETGAVAGAEVVQDVAPYGQILGESLPSWRFEPAREGGQAVPSRVLVLGFFRPPGLTFAAPERPRYKGTVAPDEIPWPHSVAVPAYPSNAVGSAKVLLELDISDRGVVTGTRVLGDPTPFDVSSTEAARQWTFRPAGRANREVASRAFVVFSFVGVTP
jgi:hypothetical protein